MLSYKDRTFCSHSKDCGNRECNRNLDENKYKEDCEIFNFEFPVAYADFKTDDCGYINDEL